MNGDGRQDYDIRIRRVTWPWPSMLGALLVIGWFLPAIDPRLAAYYGIPADWLRIEVAYALLAGLALLILFDLRRHRRQHVRQREDLERVRAHFDDLRERNRQLQLKAHTYLGHADRLKMFISEKLLEYIEYDEKFLHFKSIAAEVRHNGVISFDRVQTALQQAAASARTADPDGESVATVAAADYETALDSMRYLWDLLDLSTADNLALHVSELLCECEEHYCQRMLAGEEMTALPYEPTYSPRRAVMRALALVREATLPAADARADYVFDDGQWHARLAPVGELLGNENHLVLLVENLLRNARFFAGKLGYATPCAPVAVTLSEEEGCACLRIWNRGPHIRDSDRPNLFRLGYSTRRKREHHGRGLGLHFVHEIVKGYEGHIEVHNVTTPEQTYELRCEPESGETVTHVVDVGVVDGRAICNQVDAEPIRRREWTFSSPLRRVAVTSPRATGLLDGFNARGQQERFDPVHPERPHWRVTWRPNRNAHRLAFEPLDVSGVMFEIWLPTARHCLESGTSMLDTDIDAELEQLDRNFDLRVDS